MQATLQLQVKPHLSKTVSSFADIDDVARYALTMRQFSSLSNILLFHGPFQFIVQYNPQEYNSWSLTEVLYATHLHMHICTVQW